MAALARISQRAKISDVVANERGRIRMQMSQKNATEHLVVDGKATAFIDFDHNVAVRGMVLGWISSTFRGYEADFLGRIGAPNWYFLRVKCFSKLRTGFFS